MKGNPDGSLSNYPSLRTLKTSGVLNRLTAVGASDCRFLYIVYIVKFWRDAWVTADGRGASCK